MTKPTRVIPAKAGIEPCGQDEVGRNRPVVETQPSRQIMVGGDILVLAFATIAMRISQSYRGLC
jgi:hypothetical protein